jgi:uncharacterized protein (DUF1810 family)
MHDDDLERFRSSVRSHEATVERELRSGRKTSHWMWFMFPQLRDPGRSATALHFGLADLDEAVRYLEDTELGSIYERLVKIVHWQVVHNGLHLRALFGEPDDQKLVSSLTLFRAASQPLGRTELAEECSQILDSATFQGYGPCIVTIDRLNG